MVDVTDDQTRAGELDLGPNAGPRRRDVPPLPGQPRLGRAGLAGVLRRLHAPHGPPRTADRAGPGGPGSGAGPLPGDRAPLPGINVLDGEQATPLRGPAKAIVTNMEASLEVPTATSVRAVPAKLLEINRQILNNHLARTCGGKVSFTHLIGYAVVRALGTTPGMNSSFGLVDGQPAVVRHQHVNLGLAIDQQKPDGTRSLMVPNIKSADTLDFARVPRGLRRVAPQGAREVDHPRRLRRTRPSRSRTPA